MQGTQHFLEGVGIATNVALDQFDGSFHDEVQIAGQLALGEENGVLWIGDLLQVVDDVLSLFFREYRSKQVRLLQYGEERETGVLLVLALLGTPLNECYVEYMRRQRGRRQRRRFGV